MTLPVAVFICLMLGNFLFKPSMLQVGKGVYLQAVEVKLLAHADDIAVFVQICKAYRTFSRYRRTLVRLLVLP